mmetsp:Transcript_42609/g.138878  ORF Transcript_42609/g.138878 Transcript_42609/m.138878 type:complete len:247 (-) Transcript_42609:9-749(-)
MVRPDDGVRGGRRDEERHRAGLGGVHRAALVQVEPGALVHGVRDGGEGELREPSSHPARPLADHLKGDSLDAREGRVADQPGERAVPRRVQQRRRRAHAAPPERDGPRARDGAEPRDGSFDVVLLEVAERDVVAVREAAAGKVKREQRRAALQHLARHQSRLRATTCVAVEVHTGGPPVCTDRVAPLPKRGAEAQPPLVHELDVVPHDAHTGVGKLCRPERLGLVLCARRPDHSLDEGVVHGRHLN